MKPMKPLVLLSFSLTFLTQGFADDASATGPNNQVNVEEQKSNPAMANDSSAAGPNDQANVEEQNGNPAMANDSSAAEPSDQAKVEEQKSNPAMANDSSAAEPSDQANVEEQGSEPVMANDSFATQPTEQVRDDKPSPSMSMQSEDSQWCLSPYHEMHAGIRHNEANGIGYKDGYTTLEAFGIYDGWGSGFMPFVDLRGHVFNNGKLAGNVGIGERTLFTSINHTFGSYLYYDVRKAGHHLTVNQLSPGIELVGERMEYRINGYFPVGKNKGKKFGYAFDKFTGHNILLKFKQNQAMIGFDAEVGAHIPQNTTYDVYAAAGPYYFHSSNASAWGGKVRLLGRYKEYVTLEVAYSYDKLFRNVVQGSVAFALPFGRKLQRCGKCCPQTDNLLLSRAAFAPSRFEIPVVKKVHRKEKAINPVTGDPWFVWFVNNTSHSAGTIESPFPTLLDAQNASSPNNMIYVFSGDGTTTGMNAGITLKDGQNFFGSGIKQQFATKQGTVTIPAMSSNNPSITNTTGNVVTIGNGNVVSGFNVSTAVNNSIGIGSFNNVNGATIANNVITVNNPGVGAGVISAGINVTGTGAVNIYNNQLSSTLTMASHTVGIDVTAVGGIMTGMIANNFTSGFQFAIAFANPEASPVTNAGSFDFTIQGNTVVEYFEQGIVPVMQGASTVRILGNTVSSTVSTSGAAIFVEDDPSTISGSLIIDNNQVVVDASGSQIGIGFDSSHSTAWNLKADVTNNTVQAVSSMLKGFDFIVDNTNTLCLTMDNNTYVNPTAGSTAFLFQTTGTGVINIDSFQGNVGGPISSPAGTNLYLVEQGTCGN
jgi:hypothetical protein